MTARTAPRPEYLSRRLASLCTLAAALAMLAPPVRADEPQVAKDVAIQVMVIRATKSNDKISPELKGIAGELKRTTKYTGFKLEKRLRGGAAINKTWKGACGADYYVKVTPRSVKAGKIEMAVEITKKKGGKEERVGGTTFRASAGKSQLVSGGSYGGGDRMILAIAAR